jgi:hypothetical protein
MDTNGTGQRDATRGGIDMISRQQARPGRSGRARPEPVPVPAVEPAGRRARKRQPESKRPPESLPQPRNARPAPRNLMTAAPAPPRNARPVPPMPTGTPTTQRPPLSRALPFESAPPQPAPPQSAPRSVPRSIRAAAGSHRMPFMLLLCGLLGGALVSALLISTTLAEGSFQITGLQNSTNALIKQRQVLQEEVAQAQSAQVIQSRALKLGMRAQGQLRFLDLKTGKTSSDRGTSAENAINVPGYTP